MKFGARVYIEGLYTHQGKIDISSKDNIPCSDAILEFYNGVGSGHRKVYGHPGRNQINFETPKLVEICSQEFEAETINNIIKHERKSGYNTSGLDLINLYAFDRIMLREKDENERNLEERTIEIVKVELNSLLERFKHPIIINSFVDEKTYTYIVYKLKE